MQQIMENNFKADPQDKPDPKLSRYEQYLKRALLDDIWQNKSESINNIKRIVK